MRIDHFGTYRSVYIAIRWPSMSEYPSIAQDTTPALTSRRNPHNPLTLFSSFPKETTDVHFRWMREYGIDGVFVQRFVNGLQNGPNTFKDNITLNAVAAADANGRGIRYCWMDCAKYRILQ